MVPPSPSPSTQCAGCAAAAAPLPAHEVGNAFTRQYYGVLGLSPETANRFYHNDSCLARPSAAGDGTDCVTTLQAIGTKITETCAGMTSVEVLTVDSHNSHGGGVAILVTGRVTFAASTARAFVQSFFLAPQMTGGYYVRNDTFRYVGDGSGGTAATATANSPAKNGDKTGEFSRDSREEVQDAAGSNRLGHMLGKLRRLLLSPGLSSVSDEQAEQPQAVPVKNEPQAVVPFKDEHEPEENGFLVIN